MLDTMIYRPADLFAHHRAHRSAYEVKVHAGDHCFMLIDVTNTHRHCIAQLCTVLCFFQARFVGFHVHKMKLVFWQNVLKQCFELVTVKYDVEVFGCINAVMVAAMVAYVHIIAQLLHGAGSLALGALMP